MNCVQTEIKTNSNFGKKIDGNQDIKRKKEVKWQRKQDEQKFTLDAIANLDLMHHSYT